MIYAGLAMLAFVAGLAAWVWFRRWQRDEKVIAEWHDRWALAPALCAVAGCGEPPEADCHVPADMEVRAPWGHRFLEARMVPAPDVLVREAIGAGR